MGRKIPGKKHRGVKDPLKQQAQRLLRLKSQINAPPTDPDDQPIPKSLTRLFANTKRQDRRNHERTSGHAAQSVCGLVRMAGEDARAFSRRISAATRLLMHPPSTYPVEDEEEDAKEERKAQLRERRRRRRRALPLSAAPAPEPLPLQELTPCQEVVFERIPFGEVAHEPPTLRRARSTPLVQSLLLARQPTAQVDIDAEKRERARLAAVAAYRALKLSRKRTPTR
ncbi:hypothetical protein EVAR_23317_1 [Eumeta japonica]|uniref:Coiled-coil domain-containing protein 137 n=1 Tax=Eumeta variegata TaxID=151549 RepID=A0A4C1XX65_EUMVA|nr:hypothetical protein EVAR_23317_1 [Eumeta japonica]